jgi:hypothetical protein
MMHNITLGISILALIISVLALVVTFCGYPLTVTNGTIIDDIKTTYRGWKRGDWRKG